MTLTSQWLKAAAEFANVKAFLRVIRERESGQGADAYLMINGGGHMAGFASHPWHDIPTTQGSKACGAYQFLGTTWAGLCEQYEFSDFSPESQDLGAIALIHERGALQDVIAGKFDAAVAKLRKVWTSLPGASESSASWTLDKARAVYVNYGGLLDNAELLQPAAPIEERTPEVAPLPKEQAMPLPILALISAFGPLLAEMIPQIAKAFDKKSETPAKIEAATKIIDTVVKATGTTNIQAAVELMQQSPEALKTARDAVVTEPTIVGLLEIGGGIEVAREANLAVQNAPQGFWRNPAFWFVMTAVVPPLYGVVGVLLWRMPAPSEQLVTQVVTGILGLAAVAAAYYLGSTQSSMQKTNIIAERAKEQA
ncbi:MAG: glycoside hydrolase family 104 protein [Betaproteobacteria bacterium]|nr:glycoside hydrolase family 104 protein [Betaproteobacteria bacterium]